MQMFKKASACSRMIVLLALCAIGVPLTAGLGGCKAAGPAVDIRTETGQRTLRDLFIGYTDEQIEAQGLNPDQKLPVGFEAMGRMVANENGDLMVQFIDYRLNRDSMTEYERAQANAAQQYANWHGWDSLTVGAHRIAHMGAGIVGWREAIEGERLPQTINHNARVTYSGLPMGGGMGGGGGMQGLSQADSDALQQLYGINYNMGLNETSTQGLNNFWQWGEGNAFINQSLANQAATNAFLEQLVQMSGGQ